MSGTADPAAHVAAALARPVPPEIARLGRACAERPGVLAVLFYGNRLREPEAAGLADLYVLTEGDRAYHGAGLSALANRLLPPNVYHLPARADAPGAKVAVMRLAAFRNRMRRASWDTTLWARFAQPAALLHARDAAARAEVVAAIATACETAAWWADRLSGAPAGGADRWEALFAATYGAELRVEAEGRAGSIARAAPAFYAGLDAAFPPARPDAADRLRAARAWGRRRRAGRALNALRLVKAAATFRGGAAYALAKIERHAGAGALTPLARRAPWLAAPGLLLRLLRGRGPGR